MSLGLSRLVHGRKRPLAALTAAIACVGLAAPPASADGTIYLYAGLQQTYSLPANGVPTEVDVTVGAWDPVNGNTGTAHDVTLTIGFADGGPTTGTSSYPGCTDSALTVTCQIPQVSTDSTGTVTVPLMVTVAPGTANGTDPGISAALSSSDASGQPAEPLGPLNIVDGPNLAVSPTQAPRLEIQRGDRGSLPAMTLTNNGTEPAEGVTVVFNISYFTPIRENYGNCQNSADSTIVVCYINDVIQPGETYQVANAPTFRLRADALATPEGQTLDFNTVSFFPGNDVSDHLQYGAPFTAGTGKPLTLVRTVGTGTQGTTDQTVAQDNYPDNWPSVSQDFRATDGVTADLVAVGARAAVSGTSPVTVAVGVRDAGPATLIDHEGDGVTHVKFTVPGGATVTAAPSDCTPVTTDGSWVDPGTPGYAVYDCLTHFIKAHTTQLWDFQLTLAAGVKKTTGTVLLHAVGEVGSTDYPAGWNTDLSDDTANVVLTAGS